MNAEEKWQNGEQLWLCDYSLKPRQEKAVMKAGIAYWVATLGIVAIAAFVSGYLFGFFSEVLR